MTSFRFDNSYAGLPARFHEPLQPMPVAQPSLLALNAPLAESLGLDPAELASSHGIAVLAGNTSAPGSQPLAMAYAGHQFGRFVPALGDGRAMLLGEVIDRDGIRRDIQLKGSGRTPFSRTGDGRAALGPVLREYLLSEAFAALGIPTTRALAAVATSDTILRMEGPVRSAVLTRVATSHIRVGTFQYFAVRRDLEGLRTLTDYVIARHDPAAAHSANPACALLNAVIARQAELIARWMLVGFIHGVMNTDNMSIAGETMDFGPCAFLDAYDPGKVFSAVDRMGRYAFGNQPEMAQWNLARFAETLLPLLSDDSELAMAAAQEAIDGFTPKFQSAYAGGLRRKLGLAVERPGDTALAEGLLATMAENQADFTLVFRDLYTAAIDPEHGAVLQWHFTSNPDPFEVWLPVWRARLGDEPTSPRERQAMMRLANPAVIPRNHRVEAALRAASEGDFGPFQTLHRVLAHPFDLSPEDAAFADPPRPDQRVRRTFCGT